MASTAFEDSADYVQSLARGLRCCARSIASSPAPSLSEVAERTGLSRAVARRSLLTLQHLGYVGSRGRSFFLTPRVLELGYSYLTSLDLTELAQQSMELLSQRVGESCSMAVLDGSDIVYVLRVPVRRVMSLALGVGARLPAFAASMGRVMLADLPEAELVAWLRAPEAPRVHAADHPHRQCAEGGTAARARAGLRAGRARAGAGAVLDRRADPRRRRPRRRRIERRHAVQRGRRPARAVKQILPALQEAQHAIEQAIRRGGWLPHLSMQARLCIAPTWSMPRAPRSAASAARWPACAPTISPRCRSRR